MIVPRRWLEESVALGRELDDTPGLAVALTTLGEVKVMTEDADGAATLLEEAFAKSKELGKAEVIGWVLNHLRHIALLKSDYSRAKQLELDSIQQFRNMHDQDDVAGIREAYQSLGQKAPAAGDSTVAATHLKEAMTLLQIIRHRPGIAWCLAGQAGHRRTVESCRTRAAWGRGVRCSLGAG
jgi:hypothetical protein